MVRFKNRYLLIQLMPFVLEESGSGSSGAELGRKRRYIDVDEVAGSEHDKGHPVSPGTESIPANYQSASASASVNANASTSASVNASTCTSANTSANAKGSHSIPKLSINPASVVTFLKHELEVNFGVQGSATLSQSLTIKYTNSATGMIILRCPRDHLEKILTTVAWISYFPCAAEQPAAAAAVQDASQTSLRGGSVRCTWRVVHCAGTVKACQKAAIAFAKREGAPELVKKIQNNLE